MKLLRRHPARPVREDHGPRTSCTCVVPHALTDADVEMVRDAIVLARVNGHEDLIGYLEMRLNNGRCPALAGGEV